MKAGIQAKGQRKLSTYSRAELTMMANALIAPWFIEQVRAARSLNETQNIRAIRSPRQSLLLNETHAQNGAAK